jgi:hypothetical protein
LKRGLTAVSLMAMLCILSMPAVAQNEELTTIGAIGASNMYVTYIAVGSVADGHAQKVYDDDTTSNLLQSLAQLAQSSQESLGNLKKAGRLEKEDFEFISEMITTLELLSGQARSYIQYIKTGNKSHAQQYNEFRKKAWSKIVVLLGIEE